MTEIKPTSAAERKRLERKRKREAGLIKKEIWILPEHWEKIKKLVDKLHKII